MPNPLFARLQVTGDKLISKYGAAGTIIDTTAPASIPDTVEGGDPTYPDYGAQLVIMAYDARYVNGSTILANDVMIYISSVGLEVEPKTGMYVTAGGRTYLIVHIDPNRFDGATPVVYVAQGRTAS